MGVALRLLVLSFFLILCHWVYVHLLEDPVFRVREIEIEGCKKVNPDLVRSLILVDGMPNLFTLKIEEIAKRIETHPWIETFVMRKVFPHKITVHIEERKPIAILQLEAFYYIDTKGVIFSPVRDGDGYNFPFLTGLSREVFEKDPESSKDLLTKALEVLRVTAKEKISPLEEVSEIHMSRSYGIDCYSRANGLEVKMGKDSFGEKLRRLSIVWSDLQKRGLSVMSIDCTDLNRIVVKKSYRG